MGRAPGAVATVIDSQSVKAADTVGRDSRGYDGATKINGRKRHMVADTKGLPLFVMVTPADMTDRDAAKKVLFQLRLMHPEITTVWADSGYAGQLVTWAKKYLNLTLETVNRPTDAGGFVLLPRRWVVERSIAWVMHVRRHASDAASPAGPGNRHPAKPNRTARFGVALPDCQGSHHGERHPDRPKSVTEPSLP